MELRRLIEFLNSVDHEFNPRLSEQVNIIDYSTRLIGDAFLIDKTDNNGNLKALVVIYLNEPDNPNAYIPLVAVKKEYRQQGLAKQLVKEAIQVAKKNEKKAVIIHTNNPISYKMYKALGFQDVIGAVNRAGHPMLSYRIR